MLFRSKYQHAHNRGGDGKNVYIAAASVYILSITAAIVGVLVFAHALGFI